MNRQEKVTEVLRTLINDGGSATFARVEATVEEKQLKRGNPLRTAKITKDVVYNVMLNANYTNVVNNQREREGKDPNFEAKPNWHEKVYDGENGSIVKKRKNDDGTRYLMFVCNSAKTEAYFVNGVLATADEVATIKQFKPKTSYPNQGIDKEVIVRTVKVHNINLVKCGETVLFS